MAIIDRVPEFADKVGGQIVTTTLDLVFNWAQKCSVWPMTFGLACCAIEMMSTYVAHYDFDRFGVIPRATPRQSDLLLVSGTVTYKMAKRVRLLYEQMPEPKYVIAMGACACSGGIFQNAYGVVNGVDKIVPVDVYLPGCPPRPEALIESVMALQKQIAKGSIRRNEAYEHNQPRIAKPKWKTSK
jgi:NADH-quinone oxidoreductase subunit B